MKTKTVTFIGVGDILIDREKPDSIFQHVAETMRSADVTFANCEQMYSDKGQPNLIHASYSDPKNIPSLLNAGLDLISLANNHTLDWGPEGLLDTISRLEQAGLPYVGAGKNITEARRPVVLERQGTKLGFLAYSCTGPDGYEATDNTPGYAPVRAWTIYEKVDYQPATPPRIVSFPYKEDLAAMVEDIQNLKKRADVVIVSFHWGQHLIPRIIPMYCFDISHSAVDAGADLILGGHTHILKGIEVYRGKVIFYSLSNFAIELGPGSMNLKVNVKQSERLKTIYGSMHHPEAKATIIAKAIIQGKTIQQVSYIPCYINECEEPEIVTYQDRRWNHVVNYVEDISQSENLQSHFSRSGNEVIVLP